MPTGVFLSLDGIDGTGKSTQVQRLIERLRSLGISTTACVDPGGTELGAKLRELLLFGRQQSMSLRAEALLFMASRAELVEQVIRPALDRGEVVVSDRYALANVVYQGYAGGLSPADLWEVGRIATNDLFPDLTLVLDVPLDVAVTRRKHTADRLESRSTEYHQKVRDGFLLGASQQPGTHRVVDASGTADEVHEAIWRHVTALLRERGFLQETAGT